MSAFGGKADVNHCVGECPLLAISGHCDEGELLRSTLGDHFLEKPPEIGFGRHAGLPMGRRRVAGVAWHRPVIQLQDLAFHDVSVGQKRRRHLDLDQSRRPTPERGKPLIPGAFWNIS